MDHFIERVLAARRERGWTRRKLAQQAGLHEQHLAKVERGNRVRVEAETVRKLARALGCTTDYLLGMDLPDVDASAA